jgi:Uncharacterized protein conserved in bacteria
VDKWLNHPTIAKLVALALAFLMWAVVHYNPDSTPNTVTSTNKQKTLTLNVQPYGMDESNFILTELNPSSVTITVSASNAALFRKTDNYKLQVDLRPLGAGTHKVEIDEVLPRGVELIEMEPSTVQVTLVALKTKEYEVEVVTEGKPAKGFQAGIPIVKPSNKVHVTLPDNVMDLVAGVRASVSVEGEQETIKNKGVKLAAYDAEGNVIENAKLEPAVVEVEVPITSPFKTVPVQFRLTGHMPQGLSIASFKPDVEQATVYGPQDALDKLEFLHGDIQLDRLSSSGKYTIPLKIDPPLLEVSPEQIEVAVEVVLSETRTLEGLPIEFNGLGEGLDVKIIDPVSGVADIVVQGAPSILGSLQPGDVDVHVDLSGRGPGEHTLQLNVNLKRFMEQVGGTNSITVEIVSVPAVDAVPEEGTEGEQGEGEEETPAEPALR